MRGTLYGSIFALGLATLPAFSVASCMAGAKPSYHDISAIYFRSEGVTEPATLHRSDPVQPGACTVTVALYVSLSEVDKSGGPACFKSNSGRVYSCCGATASSTNDSPQEVFDRLVAVLQKDHFYDIATSSRQTRSDSAAFYLIAVMRCGAQSHDKNIGIALVGGPHAATNTSILALSIPFRLLPGRVYDSKILTLFDDFTHAIYESHWTEEDIW